MAMVARTPEFKFNVIGKQAKDRTSRKLTTKKSSLKQQMNNMSMYLYNAGLTNQALKQRYCFSTVVYGAYDNKGKNKEITKAYTCDWRFCPNCQQAKSEQTRETAKKIINKLDDKFQDRVCYVELTATSKNSNNASELNQNIKELNTGITKLLNYVCINDYLIGAIKFLETPLSIKYGKVSYNQHYHVLLALDKSYFNGHNRMSEKAIALKLKKAMKINYCPKIQLKRIYDTKDNNGNTLVTDMENALKVINYNSKPYKLLDALESKPQLINSGYYKKIMHDLYYGVKGTQMVSYLKECKYIKRDIQLINNLKNKWKRQDNGEYVSYYTYVYDEPTKRYKLECISSFNPITENRLITTNEQQLIAV